MEISVGEKDIRIRWRANGISVVGVDRYGVQIRWRSAEEVKWIHGTTTTNTNDPSYPNNNGNTSGSSPYGLGFFSLVVFLLITLCYGSYIYKRGVLSRSPPPVPMISIIHVNENNNSTRALSQGLDDDILVTFPTFVFSEAITDLGFTDANSSVCSICLADYKGKDVLRLLPECGHLFHVKCIDTWLKVHPTCPVCRKSPSSIV
ncbi:RING-H2 finger protein ATL70-like [Rutidosis leptorrhynchoides]|uniref:RING-H2 finger protein ATL70-like n=1 Tax=Rutidosis leptorrhynchoides TaxID=125765 RepID=UPI003A98D02A